MWKPAAILLILFLSSLSSIGQERNIITQENAAELRVKARNGTGTPQQIVLSPDGTLLVVATSGGIYVHEITDGIGIGDPQPFTGAVTAIANLVFSADGAHIFAAASDGSVQRYDVATRELAESWPVFDNAAVNAVALSPDGAFIAAGSSTGEVVSFPITDPDDRTTYSGLVIIDTVSPVRWLAFDRFEPRLFAIAARNVVAWDTGTSEKIFSLSTTSTARGSLSPDGRKLAFQVNEKDVLTVNTDDGSTRFDLTAVGAPDLEYLADGRLLLADENTRIFIEDLTRRDSPRYVSGRDFGVASDITASSDGAFIYAITSGGNLAVWQVPRSEPAAILKPYGGAVNGIAVLEDGQTVASANDDGNLYVWDTSGDAVSVIDLTAITAREDRPSLSSVAFSPDNTLVALGTSDAGLTLLSYPELEIVASLEADAGAHAAFSSDGAFLAMSGVDGLEIYPTGGDYDAPDAKEAETIDGGPIRWTGNDFTAAIAGAAAVLLYNKEEAEPYFTLNVPGYIYDFAFSPVTPNGNLIAVASGNERRFIGLYDFAGKAETLLEHEGTYVNALAFSPDGALIVTGGADGLVRVFDTADGELVATLPRAHAQIISAISFNADGTRLFTASADGTTAVWALP